MIGARDQDVDSGIPLPGRKARTLILVYFALQLSCSVTKTETGSTSDTPDATASSDVAPDSDDAPTDSAEATSVADAEPDDSAPRADASEDPKVVDISEEALPDATGDASEEIAADAASDFIGDRFSDTSNDINDALDATGAGDSTPCGQPIVKASKAQSSGTSPQVNCTSSKPCPAGFVCIGEGCDAPWQCVAHLDLRHPCPTEESQYCGCDGVTYTSTRECSDRPYDRVGACEDGVSCDPNMLRCSAPEPACPDGQVPSVVEGKYGRCVPYSACRCAFVFECPHRDTYTCDLTTMRCRTLTIDP